MSDLVLGFGILGLFLSTVYYIRILVDKAMLEVAGNYEDVIEKLESKVESLQRGFRDIYIKREDDEKAWTKALNEIRDKFEDIQDEEQISNMIDREVAREVERFITEEYDFGGKLEALESQIETIGSAFRCLGNDLE